MNELANSFFHGWMNELIYKKRWINSDDGDKINK